MARVQASLSRVVAQCQIMGDALHVLQRSQHSEQLLHDERSV